MPDPIPAELDAPVALDEAALDENGHPAGRRELAVLVAASCLPVLGAVLIAPVLPKLRDAFAGISGVEALSQITLSIPALFVGLLALVAGRIADAVGRRRLLIWTLVVYALFGTMPLYLSSLPLIVASRAGVGIAEAAIMTCCTTLLADYFIGPRRDKAFGVQTIVTTLAATVFFGLGGALGDVSWRAPFWLYASGLVFAVLVALWIWQPRNAPSDGAVGGVRRALPPVPWRAIAAPCLVTLIGGVVFYALIVELSFVLDDLGVKETSTIGAASAAASLATAAGAFVFGRTARRGTRVLLPAAFGIAGVGLLGISQAGTVPLVVVTAMVTSFGTGLLLPTLLTWAVAPLRYEQRGRGTGLWTASFFIAEFFCPLLLLGIEQGVGSMAYALGVLGVVSLVTAAAAAVLLRRSAPSVVTAAG